MEGIKSKLMGFILKQKNLAKVPEMGFSEYSKNRMLVSNFLDDDWKNLEEQICSNNHIEDLKEIYYQDSFDVACYIIKELARNNITCEAIEIYMTGLLKQKKSISNKVLENILGKSHSCCIEIENINDAVKKLNEAFWVCKTSRSFLLFAKNNLSAKSLKILAAYRKKQILLQLLESINILKNMKRTEKHVQKLLSEGKYSFAVEILLECRKSSANFNKYSCVTSLHTKINEIILNTEHQLDKILNEVTNGINIWNYEELQKAYKHLNKCIVVMDQVQNNFISAIHLTFYSILGNFYNIANEGKHNLFFEKLCGHVPSDRYITCFTDLCRSIWKILISYHHIVTWHQHHKLFPDDISNNSEDFLIQENLKIGKTRIWNDILSKMCIYLSTASDRRFKYEQYMQIIFIVQRLAKVGVEFCGSNSINLIETLHFQSSDFFQRYHITCLEEICLFIDNESWEYMATLTNILELDDFRNLKIFIQHKAIEEGPTSIDKRCRLRNENLCDNFSTLNSEDENTSNETYDYFSRFLEKSSPFDILLDEPRPEEDILSGIPDKLLDNFEADDDVVSNATENKKSNHINATCLNILRCIGRYLQMCKLLHFISPNIISAIWELVGFYAYAVNTIFAKVSNIEPLKFNSSNIESEWKKIETTVLPKILIWPLNFSSLTSNELSKSETIYGLPFRIKAIESGVSLVTQLQFLNSYFQSFLPISEFHLLNLNEHYVGIFNQLSMLVYVSSTSKLIDLKGTLNNMSKVKWDVNHVSVHHSYYIDSINRNIQIFAMTLEELSKTTEMPLSAIWESLAYVLTQVFVEGYSSARNCSAAGRALMQLDFTHFVSIFELISGLKYPKYRSYVDTFVKAYYYPPDVFTEWVLHERDCKTYSKKQLSSLIACVFSNDKRTKQRLLEIIENNSESSI